LRIFLIFFLVFLFIKVFAEDFQEKEVVNRNETMFKPCTAVLGLKHIENGGVGYNHGYTTMQSRFFFERHHEKVCSFIDLRYHILNDDTQASNIGVGVRFSPKLKYVCGLNIYYDFRDKNHHFHQIGIGAEFIGERFDIRVNGYIPVSNEKILDYCRYDKYLAGYYLERKKIEAPLEGFDLEIGRLLNHPNSNINIYTAAGPYYYGGDVCRKSFGGRIRFNTSFYKFFLIEGIVSFDSIFKTRVQGLIKINIPLGCKTKKRYKDLFSREVRRHEIIVLDKFCKWKYNY